MQTCSICQTSNKAGHIFCVFCGNDLDGKPLRTASPQGPTSEMAKTEPPLAPFPFPEEAGPDPFSGAVPFPDDAELEPEPNSLPFPEEADPKAPESTVESLTPAPPLETRKCHMCGELLSEPAAFCGVCGVGVRTS